MIKIIIQFIFIAFISQVALSQNCCKPIDDFAKLADDSKFIAKHETPIEAIEVHHAGDIIRITYAESKESIAYFVKSRTKSNKFLLVFHEWWGLNDYIKNECDRLSLELKDVNIIALDLYNGKVAKSPEEASQLMKSVDNSIAKDIINSAIAYCGANAKIATVGWCFGGGWSMQTALILKKQAKGCVIYYGMPENNTEKLKDLASDVLFVWPNKDKWINKDIVSTFQKSMKSVKKKVTVAEFDADHAFANPSNPRYDTKAAKSANAKVLSYLKAKLR